MCTACQKSINGMKRRTKTKKRTTRRRARVGGLDSNSLTTMVTQDLLPTAGGFLISSYLPGIISKMAPKAAQYGNYIAIAGGALLGVTQKGMISRVGLGLAVGGTVGVAKDLLDGSKVDGMGLLPPGMPSMRIAGQYNQPMMSEQLEVVDVQ